MNDFIEMPGTDDLVNLNHIVSINRFKNDEYLVVLTSGSFTLNRSEYLKLLDILCDINIHSSIYYGGQR